jgi:hypothetical protein
MADPHALAIKAQLDALMHEPQRRAIEVAGELEVAVQRHPCRAAPGVVKADGRQRSQRIPLDLEALVDPEAAGGVAATVADAVAPVGVLLVEIGQ